MLSMDFEEELNKVREKINRKGRILKYRQSPIVVSSYYVSPRRRFYPEECDHVQFVALRCTTRHLIARSVANHSVRSSNIKHRFALLTYTSLSSSPISASLSFFSLHPLPIILLLFPLSYSSPRLPYPILGRIDPYGDPAGPTHTPL